MSLFYEVGTILINTDVLTQIGMLRLLESQICPQVGMMDVVKTSSPPGGHHKHQSAQNGKKMGPRLAGTPTSNQPVPVPYGQLNPNPLSAAPAGPARAATPGPSRWATAFDTWNQ